MGTVHYHNYRHHWRTVKWRGCGDRSPAGKAKAAEWGVPAFDTVQALVESTGADVVDVCTPTYLHKTHVSQALEAGAHVIVEKPCALTRADAEAMFGLARARGRHLYVAQVLQFSREVEVLRRLVEEGTYGRPLDALFQRLSARPEMGPGAGCSTGRRAGWSPSICTSTIWT